MKKITMKIFLVVLFAISAAFASLSVTNWTTSQDSYVPGSTGVLSLTLANPLISGITDVQTVAGVDIDIAAPSQVIITEGQFVGDIEPGGSTKISIPFKISPNASSSIYSIEAKVTGVSDRPEGYGSFDTFSRRALIPITVVNEPIIILSTDKQRIGGVESIRLTITNNGGPASNIRISIPDSSNISLYGTTEVYLASLPDSINTNLTLDARGNSDGLVNLPISIRYEDEIGVTRTSNVTLRLTVRNERVDLTFTQQSDILTKDETTLILSVRNSGTEELKDVRLSFKNNTIRLKDHDELKFGDIRPGQNVTATGIAYADLPPGINLVDTEVSWIEKDVQKEESRKIPITISSDADVGVYLEGRPLPLMIGSNHTISTLVSNFGSYKIENVDVSIESPALSSMDISDKQYIGGLQTDDFSTVQFSMKVNATSEGEYPVYITINYRDQSGEWKQKRITQSINVYAPIQIQQSPIPIIFGALVMLALIVWYFMFRKVQE